jgi:hypothetical protein
MAGFAGGAHAQTTTGPSFQVALTLSPAAVARLANPHETVIVYVEFYGVPAAEKLRMADQGRSDVAPKQQIEVAGAGVVRFAGPVYDRSKLKSMEGGQLDVSVDGVSGRRSDPNNLLMCTDVDDLNIQVAASQPVKLYCKLLTEM